MDIQESNKAMTQQEVFDNIRDYQREAFIRWNHCVVSGKQYSFGFDGYGNHEIRINGKTHRKSAQLADLLVEYNEMLPEIFKLF